MYVCMYVYIYIYEYMNMCVYIYIYIYTHIHTHINEYDDAWLIRIPARREFGPCSQTSARQLPTIYAYIYIYIHMYVSPPSKSSTTTATRTQPTFTSTFRTSEASPSFELEGHLQKQAKVPTFKGSERRESADSSRRRAGRRAGPERAVCGLAPLVLPVS